MFVRNFLSNCEYVSVVPVGILITLQYDAKGRIEKILHGATEGGEDVSSEYLKIVLEKGLVPRTLLVTGGRTWVSGVFYTRVHSFLNKDGILPECIYTDLKKAFLKSPEKFVFAACSAKSLATVFQGSLAVRQWLAASGFNLLPGTPLSSDVLQEENFRSRLEKFLGEDKYFDFPLIAGYCVYSNGKPTYHPANMRIEVVKSFSQCTDYHGHILMKINDNMTIDYNQCVNHYCVEKGTALLIDYYGEVIHSYKNGMSSVQNKQESIKCPVCGNMFVPRLGTDTVCTDPHCNSRLFIPTNNMLCAYKLPKLSYEKYQSVCKDYGREFSIPDVLNLPEYNYAINVDLPTLLYGIIPRDVMADYNSIKLLCNRCYNNPDNMMYQMSNPGVLAKNSDIPEVSNLVVWVRDERNLKDIEKLLNNKNIVICDTNRQFNGAPVLRNVKAFITGDFLHGTSQDIRSIISSYSGSYVNQVADCNVVIVGGTQMNIDGRAIKYARDKGLTILDENTFFSRYSIDEDLDSYLK